MKPAIFGCCVILGTAMVAAPLFKGQDRAPAAVKKEPPVRAARAHVQGDEEDGERVFEQNCARCHNAPDGFSQRITGTIVRHMRVRANLSRHDEEVLLRYFNP